MEICIVSVWKLIRTLIIHINIARYIQLVYWYNLSFHNRNILILIMLYTLYITYIVVYYVIINIVNIIIYIYTYIINDFTIWSYSMIYTSLYDVN